jgi:hypothetical protein
MLAGTIDISARSIDYRIGMPLRYARRCLISRVIAGLD